MEKEEAQNVAVENASPEANAAGQDKQKRKRTKQNNKEANVNGTPQYRVKGQDAKGDNSAPAENGEAPNQEGAKPIKKQRNRKQQ